MCALDSGEPSIVIVAGVSGSGKSSLLSLLEDYGYFCVENLPHMLLQETIAYLKQGNRYQRIAISLSSLTFLHSDGLDISSIKVGFPYVKLWFIECDRKTLLKRYDETRRPHPFFNQSKGLLNALELEDKALLAFSELADQHIDTSALTLQTFRKIVKERLILKQQPEHATQIHIFSFGFKYGMPEKADYLFDVRVLPNPFWDKKLRILTGLDKPVVAYLERHSDVVEMYSDIYGFLNKWLKAGQQKEKSYIEVAIGCTGGQHRSVYMVEKLYQSLSRSYSNISITHQELNK